MKRVSLIVSALFILNSAFCISGFAAALDSFDDISRWKAVPADGVEMRVS